jgi:hypothetical protein
MSDHSHSHSHHHHHHTGHVHPPVSIHPSILRISAVQRVGFAAVLIAVIWAAAFWTIK